MNANGRFGQRVAVLAGTALALATGSPAAAQQASDVNTFQLPPGGASSPAPPVVAPPPPVVVKPTPAPTPRAAPTPKATATPKPSASPTPRPTATPGPRPSASPAPRPSASPSPTPSARATERPAEAPVAKPSAAPSAPAPLPSAVPLPTEAAPVVVATPAAAPTATPAPAAPIWPWLAGGAALLAAVIAFLLLRRRKAEEDDYYYEEEAEEAYAPPAAAPLPSPSPPATLPKRAVSERAPIPQPAPAAPAPREIPEPALSLADAERPAPAIRKASDHVGIALTARRLSATLINTALTYELVVTNTGEEAIGPIAVSGDMIGAHASIPPKVLLEVAADGEPHHRIPRLEPGESAAMSGELRLPLASITPIRHGAATLFVPLARFRVLVFRDGRPPVSANHAFVVGEEPATPGAALKPFRLDLGPRLYSSITQRELTLPA